MVLCYHIVDYGISIITSIINGMKNKNTISYSQMNIICSITKYTNNTSIKLSICMRYPFFKISMILDDTQNRKITMRKYEIRHWRNVSTIINWYGFVDELGLFRRIKSCYCAYLVRRKCSEFTSTDFASRKWRWWILHGMDKTRHYILMTYNDLKQL